jgi:hypothetical protein
MRVRVDPPADSTPIWVWCRACQPNAAGTAADGHHYTPVVSSWILVFMSLCSGAITPLNPPVQQGVRLALRRRLVIGTA